MTRQALVDSSVMNVKIPASDFCRLARIRPVTSALPKNSPNAGVRRRDSRAKIAGNTPVLAIAAGSSPVIRIQPLRQPNALIATNAPSSLPAPSPHSCRARSEKGASELASCAPGSSNSTALQATMHSTAVRMPPVIVARGIVRAGSCTLSAGIVADSMPSSPHSVSVTAAVVPDSVRCSCVTGEWLSAPTEYRPTPAMANSGSSFSTVVTDDTQPDALMPYQLIRVSPHNTASVVPADSAVELASRGNSGVR